MTKGDSLFYLIRYGKAAHAINNLASLKNFPRHRWRGKKNTPKSPV
jgi:hypothetical protein